MTGSGEAATVDHYDKVAEAYEDSFFYASAGKYQDWLLGTILEQLDAREGHTIVDIGGGTGNFTEKIYRAVRPARNILCVDVSEEMLRKAAEQPGVDVLHGDTSVYCATKKWQPCHRMLMKEVVHHFDVATLDKSFAEVFDAMAAGGKVVIVTRPQEVDYPFFSAAHKVWADNQAHHSVFEKAMGGFRVSIVNKAYPATIPKAQWLKMVQNRFWSTFSHFSDSELEDGLQELRERYHDTEELAFEDRLLFIIGTK